MENLSPVYDNTFAGGFFATEEQTSMLSDKEKNQLLQVLTNSLDLQELGAIVFSESKRKLNASFCHIVSNTGRFKFGDYKKGKIVKTFDLTPGQDGSVVIEYGFAKGLSLRENQLLKDITQCAQNPVRNALKFFQIQRLALKDSLTSLGNRLQFDETLQKTISHAQRNHEKVALIVMDLDKFKPVNDKFGHAEGDKVLISIAGAIKNSLRSSDHAFRFGGDEFCCITCNTDHEVNNKIVRRIQTAVNSDPLLQQHDISCSFGLAMLETTDAPESVFQRADNALYKAKENGRNCAMWG